MLNIYDSLEGFCWMLNDLSIADDVYFLPPNCAEHFEYLGVLHGPY